MEFNLGSICKETIKCFQSKTRQGLDDLTESRQPSCCNPCGAITRVSLTISLQTISQTLPLPSQK